MPIPRFALQSTRLDLAPTQLNVETLMDLLDHLSSTTMPASTTESPLNANCLKDFPLELPARMTPTAPTLTASVEHALELLKDPLALSLLNATMVTIVNQEPALKSSNLEDLAPLPPPSTNKLMLALLDLLV